MVTRRKEMDYWTKVYRTIIGDDGMPVGIKVTTCCCNAPGDTRKECQRCSGNKTPCRCDCHSEKP